MRRAPRTDYRLSPEIVDRIPWFRKRLLSWFRHNKREFPWRELGRTPYEVLVAEILLQRTTAKSVANSYLAFLEKYPSWSTLAAATQKDLEDALRPFGLWREKAKVFHGLSQSILLRDEGIPTTREELEELEGIGQYIASAVLVVLFEKSEPLLDVNMARVLERFFGPRELADIRDDPYLQTLARYIIDGENSTSINWAILDFSALVCKARNPLCPSCPVRSQCLYYRDIMSQIPRAPTPES